MLNYYLYLVTKEHKQKPNRLQETRSPFSIFIGIALGLLLCTAGNTLQEGWDFSPSALWWSGQKATAKNVSLGGICWGYQIKSTSTAITMGLLQLQPYPVSPSCQEMPLDFGRGREEALQCHALCSWLLCPAWWWQKSTGSREILPHCPQSKQAAIYTKSKFPPFHGGITP